MTFRSRNRCIRLCHRSYPQSERATGSFFSRMLHGPEIGHASVEKEAQAIIEAIRHYLTGRKFTITTDQRSVAYMFDNKQKGKIKNDKIMRWRTELSYYRFDIVYRPGAENIPPDTLSRAFSPSAESSSIIHFVIQVSPACTTL